MESEETQKKGQVVQRARKEAGEVGRGSIRWRDVNGCFFFNDTATTEIYTLSLHDALPISPDINFRSPYIRKMEKMFGYSPSVSLEEGIKRTEEWMRHETTA